jgi:hypothetical protein
LIAAGSDQSYSRLGRSVSATTQFGSSFEFSGLLLLPRGARQIQRIPGGGHSVYRTAGGGKGDSERVEIDGGANAGTLG